MSFISLSFLVFFAISLLIMFVIQKLSLDKLKKIALLFINYFFYSMWDIRFSLLLLVLSIVVFYCGKHTNEKGVYRLGIVFPVVVLAFFKYFNFFLSNLNFDTLNIILPLGISFYTFEAISYVVDCKRKIIEPESDFITFATYLSFFPNIVSGPIARAKDLLIQIKEDRKVSLDNILIGIQIMAIGYFKKMVIADRLGVFVNDVFARPGAFNWLTVIFALISYSIQIYMDFSGYSDVAIGVAKCFGYDFKKNFDLPYVSKSVTEFWRRWHISLSTWFKDYVYIPLGGNRKGKNRQLLNLLIVMTLSGLWHGANFTFVVWGFINGILLCLEKILLNGKKTNGFNWLITFVLINFAWIFFRANTINDAFSIIKAIFTLQDGIKQPYLWSFFGIIVTIVITLLILKRKNRDSKYGNYLLQDLSTIKGLTIFFILLGLIICLAYTNVSPFVYFQF